MTFLGIRILAMSTTASRGRTTARRRAPTHATMLAWSLTFMLTLCIGNGARAQNLSSSWQIRSIASSPQEAIDLTLNGRFIDRLPRQWFEQVVQIADRLSGDLGIRPPALILFYDPAPNAFATYTTGGTTAVGINTEMMRLASGDAAVMAAVIGHELGHLKADHQRKLAQNRKALDGLGAIVGTLLDITAATRGIYTGGAAQALAGMGTNLAAQKFSRDQEREADEIGLRAMHRQGYDPYGAGQLWDRMQLFGGAGVGGWLDSHPSSNERQATLDRLAQSLKPTPKKPAPINRPALAAAAHAPSVAAPQAVVAPAALTPAAPETSAAAPVVRADPAAVPAPAAALGPAPAAAPAPAPAAAPAPAVKIALATGGPTACAPGSLQDGKCIRQGVPKNARVAANGEWECEAGFISYEQRICIPHLGR